MIECLDRVLGGHQTPLHTHHAVEEQRIEEEGRQQEDAVHREQPPGLCPAPEPREASGKDQRRDGRCGRDGDDCCFRQGARADPRSSDHQERRQYPQQQRQDVALPP